MTMITDTLTTIYVVRRAVTLTVGDDVYEWSGCDEHGNRV